MPPPNPYQPPCRTSDQVSSEEPSTIGSHWGCLYAVTIVVFFVGTLFVGVMLKNIAVVLFE